MTLEEAAKGVDIEKAVYNIGFNDGDETQFDVQNFTDLEELWNDFCKMEGLNPDSIDYVNYVGKWERETSASEQIAMLRQDGYKIAAEMLESYVSGRNEFEFIKAFICQGHHRGDFGHKVLRCLWTTYCYHNNLEPDISVYDSTILELWHLIGEEITADWNDFDSFDFYMGVLLA